jgi:hypothetical protein
MWQLTVKLKDTGEAAQFLEQLDLRDELDAGTVRVNRYPDDGQAVARSMDRAPLASLVGWAAGFSSARLSLTEEAYGGGDEVYE